MSFHFVLRKVLYQTKYCSSRKVQMFGNFKNFGLAMSLALFLHMSMIQTCTYPHSRN